MGRRPLPKRISPFLTRPLTLVSLWGISSPFELLSPSSGQVTNALLTRSPLGFHKSEDPIFLVRLACIRHAASVHPEPGSNSPYNLSFPCGNVHYGSLLLTCFTSYHSSIVKVPLSPSANCRIKSPDVVVPFRVFSSALSQRSTNLSGSIVMVSPVLAGSNLFGDARSNHTCLLAVCQPLNLLFIKIRRQN